MAKPPNPRPLTLVEAAAFVADRRQIEPDEARRILLRLLQSGAIVARGAVPLNAHPDAGRAWQLSVSTNYGDIPSGTWFLEVDWILGRVGRYRHITIAETDLTALFRASRGPGTRAALDAVKKAVGAYVKSEQDEGRNTSTKRAEVFVRGELPGVTRAQILEALHELGTPKLPGRPCKKNSSE
jgi:hypothetical protein